MPSGGSKRRKFGIKQRAIAKPKPKRISRPKRQQTSRVSRRLGRILAQQLAEGDSTLAPTSARKFGVKAPVSRGESAGSGHMQACPVNCPGEYVEGMWIHSDWCRYSAVLWRVHGKTRSDWTCPYSCTPIEISSGWTHPHDCPFWDETGRTPFDHAPPNVVRSVGRVQLPRVQPSPSELSFEDFPEALDEDDSELPF